VSKSEKQIIEIDREVLETLCKKVSALKDYKLPNSQFARDLQQAINLADQLLNSISMGVLIN